MNLLLTVMFGCVMLGLVARQPGRRENAAIVVIAVVMTTLYYFVTRFVQ